MFSIDQENKNYHHLVDEAEGAYLKKEYLEAFLIQSCIIEGVVKNYATKKLTHLITANDALKSKFDNWDISRLVDSLLIAGKIDKTLYTKLNEYRKKRNSVIHDLLSHQDKILLDAELKSAYELGKEMKGFIVDDMNKGIGDATVAELNGQINDLLSTIFFLQKELVKANRSGTDETARIMVQIGESLQALEEARNKK